MGIYYELRKMALRRSSLVLLLILLCLNALTIFIQYCNSGGGFEKGIITPYNVSEKEWKYYLQLREKYQGPLTIEKIEDLKDDYNEAVKLIQDGTFSQEYSDEYNTGYIYGDYSMISEHFFEPIKSIVNYSEDMKEITKKLDENVQYYKRYNNVYNQEKNIYMKEKYENRFLNMFYDTDRLQTFIDYHISDIFIILILMITILPAFLSEKQNEMEDLLKSVRMGNKCMRVDKYLATSVWIIGVTCLFLLENFILFLLIYQIKGINAPVYLLTSFKFSSLDLNVWQFYLLHAGCQILAFEILGSVFLAISKMFKKHYQTYIVAIIISIILLYLAGFFAADESIYTWLYLLNPLSLLNVGNVFTKIYSVNFFGHFMERGYLCIGIWCIICVMFYLQKGVLQWRWWYQGKKKGKKKVFLQQK